MLYKQHPVPIVVSLWGHILLFVKMVSDLKGAPMNRRSFLKLLGAAVTAPFVAKRKAIPRGDIEWRKNTIFTMPSIAIPKDAVITDCSFVLDVDEEVDERNHFLREHFGHFMGDHVKSVSIWIQPNGSGTEIYPLLECTDLDEKASK
jgi:hypothetical protein